METIAAISTPDAPGGIAMLRVSGDCAIEIAAKIFRAADGRKIQQMQGYSCVYGYVYDQETQLDDVVLTVFRTPHSYTGEDTVEITCHGGLYLTKRILKLLYQAGAVPAQPGEFTRRAYLNGKLSLSQAEAVMDVIRADGDIALSQANYARGGRLGKEMQAITDALVEMLSALAYWMDDAEEFPQELSKDMLHQNINNIYDKLKEMSVNYEQGMIYRNGIQTVLLGKPNAGKSTVMNRLCGRERSIVTDIAGTTRDVVSEQVKIGEFTLVLSDTAGLRETDNQIENIGISQALQRFEDAQLVLYIVDASKGIDELDYDILKQCKNKKCVLIWNKKDLTDLHPDIQIPVFETAAKYEFDYHEFADLLKQLFGDSSFSQKPCVLNERQNLLIQHAAEKLQEAIFLIESSAPLDFLYAVLEEAADELQKIDGKTVSEDVIDGVFSYFCVGK